MPHWHTGQESLFQESLAIPLFVGWPRRMTRRRQSDSVKATWQVSGKCRAGNKGRVGLRAGLR